MIDSQNPGLPVISEDDDPGAETLGPGDAPDVRPVPGNDSEPGSPYRKIIESLGACPYSAIPAGDGGFRMEFSEDCTALTGYRAEEYAADPTLWHDSIPSEDLPVLYEAMTRILSGTGLARVEHRIRHKDGSMRRLRNTLVSIWDEAGHCFRFAGALRAIIEPKLSEELPPSGRKPPDRRSPELDSAPRETPAVAPGGVRLAGFVTDAHGMIIDCDTAFVKLFGFQSAEDALWTSIIELYPEPSEYDEALRILRWNGRLKQHACVRRRKDGAALHLIEELGGEFDMEGNLTRIAGSLFDFLTCAEPSEHDEPYRRIVETSNEGIWVVGANLRATYVNDVMARMLGYTPAEMLGMTFVSLVHEEDIEDHLREMERRKKGLPGKYIRRLRRKDGSTLRAIVSSVSILDAEGRFSGSIAMCVDITSLEQAREALGKSEERWKFALEGSNEGVWDWNVVSDELFLSPGMLDLLGSTDPTRISRMEALIQRIHPEDTARVSDALRNHLDNLTGQLHAEFRLRRDDGASRWVLSRGKVMERDLEGKPLRMIGTCTDITDRKESEEALRQSEEHYRTILRTALDGFHILDTRGRILDVNDAFCQMIGYDRDDLLRMVIGDIDVGMDLVHLDALGKEIVRDRSRRFETRFKTRGGRILDVDVSVNHVPSDGGRFFCFARDISHRRLNERLLEESRELYRMVTESISDIVSLMDETGVIRYVSPSIEQITGWSVADILGTSPSQLVHPEDLPEIRKAFAPLFEGSTEIDFEFRLRHKDGVYKWIEQSVRLVPDTAGGQRRYVLCGRDITRRKQVEEELRQNEEKYRHLFEMESDALALIDIESESIIDVNSSACRLYGYPREEILARKHHVFSAEPEQSRKTVQERRTLALQRMHRKKDGTVFPVEISLSYLTFKGRQSVIAAIRDVTDRKRLEEEVLRVKKLDAMSILAGGIAHDFNNLMGIVLGNTEMAEMELDPDHPARKFLGEARKATLKSREITQRFLNLSSGGHLSKLATRIAPIVEAAVAGLGNERDIPVHTSIPDNVWRVRVDRREMGQALANALQNAVEVSPPGGRVTLTVENITAEDAPGELRLADGPYVKIEISDQGEGIPEEHLTRIFDPYFTTKQRGTRKGTGLGLAITHAAVSQHDGRIRVESGPGKGTRFIIYLPALQS